MGEIAPHVIELVPDDIRGLLATPGLEAFLRQEKLKHHHECLSITTRVTELTRSPSVHGKWLVYVAELNSIDRQQHPSHVAPGEAVVIVAAGAWEALNLTERSDP